MKKNFSSEIDTCSGLLSAYNILLQTVCYTTIFTPVKDCNFYLVSSICYVLLDSWNKLPDVVSGYLFIWLFFFPFQRIQGTSQTLVLVTEEMSWKISRPQTSLSGKRTVPPCLTATDSFIYLIVVGVTWSQVAAPSRIMARAIRITRKINQCAHWQSSVKLFLKCCCGYWNCGYILTYYQE